MFSDREKPFPEHIKSIFSQYKEIKTCWVAYSGGLDSHVLLHTLAEIQDELQLELIAVHINHQTSPHANTWQQHCHSTCTNYGIKLLTFTIDISEKNDQGAEALAREKRYAIFHDLLETNDLLMTAHHSNDQIETILLQLIRGCGPDGLVGMPYSRALGKGHLIRPLLNYERAKIHQYGLQESLHWVEDESNQSKQYDRNFLRHDILPNLLKRWPSLPQTIQRSATHQVAAKLLLDETSNNDLKTVSDKTLTKINITKFLHLPIIRKTHVLRAWIKHNGFRTPSTQLIEKIDKEVIHAGNDRMPCLKWRGAEVRRYHKFLYIIQPLTTHNIKQSTTWDIAQPLQLGISYLKATANKGNGIKQSMLPSGTVLVKFRQGGEKIQLSDQTHPKRLKKLFNERKILPWLRDRLPLIFYRDELIAVADLWVAKKYSALPSELAWEIHWEKTTPETASHHPLTCRTS